MQMWFAGCNDRSSDSVVEMRLLPYLLKHLEEVEPACSGSARFLPQFLRMQHVFEGEEPVSLQMATQRRTTLRNASSLLDTLSVANIVQHSFKLSNPVHGDSFSSDLVDFAERVCVHNSQHVSDDNISEDVEDWEVRLRTLPFRMYVFAQ